MDKLLSRLEASLQRLIEGGSSRLFSSQDLKGAFSSLLAERMQADVQFNREGQLVAPHSYTIELNNPNAELLNANLKLIADLQTALKSAAADAKIHLSAEPKLQFRASKKIPKGDFKVSSSGLKESLSNTQSLELSEQEAENQVLQGAFLIVNGSNIFPLTQSIVNIGRKNDNHLVIDDSHVSRHHAQLRAISESYHFFDLGSTGGSTINEQVVKNAALHAGDVISLAGIPLIYGQDAGSAETETQEIKESKRKDGQGTTTDLKPSN